MSKQAKIDVILNSEKAKAALKDIQEQLKQVKILRDKAAAEGDVKGFNQLNSDFKKLNTEAGKFEKQAIDINAIFKNLSGASIREINAAYQQMNKELKDMKRNDPGFAEKQAQVKALKNELSSSTGPVTGFNAAWSSVKGVMALAAGVMAGLSGAIGFGKSVIESTGATAREFKAITTGLTWAWDEFKKAIATSDFSNMLINMGDAITAGREYVNLLADVKKSTRALSITNSELNIEFQKLKVVERDVSKPMEERIAAGKKALDIEMKMTKDSQEVAKKAMDAELLHLRTITKLKDEDIKAAVATYNSNKKNLDLANEYNKALETTSAKNAQATSQTRKTPEGEAAYQRTITLVDKASPEIKKLAGVMKAMGKTTGEELDAMAEKWVTYNNVEVESIQKTARVKITLGRLEKGYLDDTNRDEKAAAKEHEKIVREANKTLAQLIAEKDAQIDAAIQSGNIPLAEKLQIEKKAMEDLAETYRLVKEEIAKGWDLNQRDQGTIDTLIGIGAKVVKSDNPKETPLKKRKSDSKTGPSDAIQIDEEKVKKTLAEIRDASFQLAEELNNSIFTMVTNHQQVEYNQQLNQIEGKRQKELASEKLTEEEKKKINEKYDKQAAVLRAKQFEKDQRAAVIQALINGALGITQTLAKYGFTPVGWIAAAGMAASTIIQIAAIRSQKTPEFYEGGYTDKDNSDKKPVGIVHANEFIGSAAAVRNPSIKRYFDVIDYAQKVGTVSQINLSSLEPNTNDNQPGFKSGGYTKPSSNSNSYADFMANSNHRRNIDLYQIDILGRLAEAVIDLQKNGVKGNWYLRDLEKIQTNKRNLESSVDC